MIATPTSNASSIRRQFNAEVTRFMISDRRGQFKVQNLSFTLHPFTPSLIHRFIYDGSQISKHGLFIWEVVKAHVATSPKYPETFHYRNADAANPEND